MCVREFTLRHGQIEVCAHVSARTETTFKDVRIEVYFHHHYYYHVSLSLSLCSYTEFIFIDVAADDLY